MVQVQVQSVAVFYSQHHLSSATITIEQVLTDYLFIACLYVRMYTYALDALKSSRLAKGLQVK